MDRNQFWTQLENEHARAEAFCRRLTGSREKGDDLYQEAVLKGCMNCQSLREEQSFRPWLYRIIVNLYRNSRREPWWRRLVSLSAESIGGAPGWDPSGSLYAQRWLERAFSAVAPEERSLVTLFEIEGWTIAELSQLLNRPPGTIKARLSRARAKMRRKLMAYPVCSERNLSATLKPEEAPVCIVTKPEPE